MLKGIGKFSAAGKWAACLAIAFSPWAAAAVPGAWEEFSTKANADAWLVYDDSNGIYYYPNWESAGNPYIHRIHYQDFPVSFMADSYMGKGALIGSYADVSRIYCDVFIESLNDFEELDCSIYTNGPAGPGWYYSYPYYYDDFATDGWNSVIFGMSETWYYYNGTENVSFVPDAAFLAGVQKVAITFYPRLGYFWKKAGIDNFILEPKVAAPKLVTATSGNDFQISFLKAAGVSYTVEKMTTVAPFTWSVVPGQAGITGTGPQVFMTPRDESKKIFRVKAESFYTPVVSSP